MSPSDGACPSCDRALTPGARFCAHCGTQVAQFAEVAERRLVTVAFFDMVGSTPIAEGMDPEEFRDLVLAYQDLCVAAIEGEQGYVADYRGDGILAYFGYPRAHEDDAVRAVRASLRAVERVRRTGSQLQMRAGLHTGVVVVGEMGAGMRRKHDVVMGDTPNVAARIQSTAEPGSVLISQTTCELLSERFEMDDLGTPVLKGITRTIRLYRVNAEIKTRAETATQVAPLVDRQTELAGLHERFERAASAAGQLVVVEGEPGVGKSRLIQSFREAIETTPHTWIELRGTPMDRLSSLRPVIEILSAAPETAGDDDVQLLRSVIGLPVPDLGLTPIALRRRKMEALVRWFVAHAQDQPLVLLVEDAHWLDPTTAELLAALAQAIASERVLLLATSRGNGTTWPDVTHRMIVRLEPLPDGPAADLARSIAGDRLSDETIADVVARTDGVPLFVEEITRAIIEGGTTIIPTSLQQSLAARLDRLGDARELAQVAAVVGRDFDGELLATLLDRERSAIADDLRVLVGSGLVERTGDTPDQLTVYRFRHSLVRDVAYESLLRARRRELHGKVAITFRDLLPNLAESQPEVIAHHYSEAGETRPAMDFWTRAAQRASEHHALTEGVQHATKAIDAVRELEASDERDQSELGLIFLLNRLIVQSTGPHDPRNEEIFLRAGELTSSLSDDSLERFTVRSGLCAFYIGHARFPEALDLAGELMAVAQRAGRRTFLMSANSWLGDTQYHRGDLEDALHYFREAFALYRPDRDMAVSEFIGLDFGVNALLHIAYVLWYLGDADEAAETMQKAHDLGEQLSFSFPSCHVLVGRAILHALAGEADAAMDHADRATTMADEHEWWLMSGQAAFAKGRALWLAGKAHESVRILGEAVEKMLRPGGFGGATMGLTWLAEAQLDSGDLAGAAATVKRTEVMIGRTDERFFEAELRRMNARVLAAVGKTAEAAEELERALAVACAQRSVALEQSVRRQLTTGRAGT